MILTINAYNTKKYFTNIWQLPLITIFLLFFTFFFQLKILWSCELADCKLDSKPKHSLDF